MTKEIIGLDYGVGYLDPDQHDPNIIYSEDYPEDDDEWYDEYYLEAKYLDEEED